MQLYGLKNFANRRTRRTTLTLEVDVAQCLSKKLASDRRLKEENLVNDLLRKGIRADESKSEKQFKIKPFKTKLASGMTAKQLEEMIREI